MDKYYYKLSIGDWSSNFLTPEQVVNAIHIQFPIKEGMDGPVEEMIEENYHDIADWHRNLSKYGPDWEISAGDFEVKAIKFEGWKVKLTYFKESGKCYTSGEYTSKCWDMFQIFDEVREMVRNRKLPDLVEGACFITLIDVPDHPHNHPALFFPNK